MFAEHQACEGMSGSANQYYICVRECRKGIKALGRIHRDVGS